MNNGENVVFRFYKYPSIQVMRRFPEVGVELWNEIARGRHALSAALEAAYMSQHIGADSISNEAEMLLEKSSADLNEPFGMLTEPFCLLVILKL